MPRENGRTIDGLSHGPVAVGGVGGSGTRIVAEMLAVLGFRIGSDLNEALDNLSFTLLFKRPRWFFRQADLRPRVETGLRIFGKTMTGGARLDGEERRFLARATAEVFRHGHDHLESGRGWWAVLRARAILRAVRRPGTDGSPWGWKEPNTHIFLECLAGHFPDLRYVHVIRHGLDMAFSPNRAQLHNWGALFGVEVPKDILRLPQATLDYWIRSNDRAIAEGRRLLGDRFLVVNFDRLMEDPEPEIEKLLGFVPHGADDAELTPRLRVLVRKPRSIGRYRDRDVAIFSPDSLRDVERLGFKIER